MKKCLFKVAGVAGIVLALTGCSNESEEMSCSDPVVQEKLFNLMAYSSGYTEGLEPSFTEIEVGEGTVANRGARLCKAEITFKGKFEALLYGNQISQINFLSLTQAEFDALLPKEVIYYKPLNYQIYKGRVGILEGDEGENYQSKILDPVTKELIVIGR